MRTQAERQMADLPRSSHLASINSIQYCLLSISLPVCLTAYHTRPRRSTLTLKDSSSLLLNRLLRLEALHVMLNVLPSQDSSKRANHPLLSCRGRTSSIY